MTQTAKAKSFSLIEMQNVKKICVTIGRVVELLNKGDSEEALDELKSAAQLIPGHAVWEYKKACEEIEFGNATFGADSRLELLLDAL